ncbi:MAG: GNAT family N-acetyltransferase [Magnetovibrio sp.]|nr:GNAT family N-acetyltransferase [Magnetovibrio sp.]|tara:strand:- start:1220 stop:1777 length:558 start_codon:yes stop_codon:yes gene_type:complete
MAEPDIERLSQRHILTSRLQLVPFTANHITDTYIGWLNDPSVTRFSKHRSRSHDRASCEAFLKTFVGSDSFFWALELQDDSYRHFGNMVAYVDRPNSTANLTIMLGEEDLWGHGYGLEAWNGGMTFLLDEVGLRKVWAGTMATNAGMLKIMKNSGMISDGVRRREYMWEGKEVDLVYMATFRGQA